MALRKPTLVLADMLEHADVVSEVCLEPVPRIDPDEVIDIWNAASDHIRTHKDPRGRGRGRGKRKHFMNTLLHSCDPLFRCSM